ncbi:calmodulin-domain protein kinase cdpk isoform 2 [Sarracenia purpurea var. burkii]
MVVESMKKSGIKLVPLQENKTALMTSYLSSNSLYLLVIHNPENYVLKVGAMVGYLSGLALIKLWSCEEEVAIMIGYTCYWVDGYATCVNPIFIVLVLVGHLDYEVTGGSIIFKGENVLEMDAEERSLTEILMSFQSSIEIPGASNIDFLNMAYNARRRKLG